MSRVTDIGLDNAGVSFDFVKLFAPTYSSRGAPRSNSCAASGG